MTQNIPSTNGGEDVRGLTIPPGESRTFAVPPIPEDAEYPLRFVIMARGRGADLHLQPGNGVRWTRLPVPWYRRIWVFITGRQRWEFEGWPIVEGVP